MDHLAEILQEHPGTTLFRPSCGTKAAYAVLKAFGQPPESLEALEKQVSSGLPAGEASLLTIKQTLQDHGLRVYPMRISLERVSGNFESVVAVLHVEPLREVDSSGDHFVVFAKNSQSGYLVDGQQVTGLTLGNRHSFDPVNASYGYKGVCLVVSDAPLDLRPEHTEMLSAAMFAAALIMTALGSWTSSLFFRRKR